MQQENFLTQLKTYLTTAIILPISVIAVPFIKRKEITSQDFFVAAVDYKQDVETTLKTLERLNIHNILAEFTLDQIEELDLLKSFLEKNKERKVTLKISRNNGSQEKLQSVFSKLHHELDMVTIEAELFSTAYQLKEKEFQELKLIGDSKKNFSFSSIIDMLFSINKNRYNGISTKLPNTTPEDTQFGLTFADKIALVGTLLTLSPKSDHKLYIDGSGKYASQEKNDTNHMLRYHLLAFASQQVDAISYKLPDESSSSFKSYQFMIRTLRDAQFLRLDIKRSYYILQCWINEQLVQIHWSLKETSLKNENYFEAYDKNGVVLTGDTLKIGASPVYLFIIEEVGEKVNCL